MHPEKQLRIANSLMPTSIITMLLGAYVGFIDHENWSLQAQVTAHISVLLGAVFLKLSYVLHLNASKHLEINDFIPSGRNGELRPSEHRLPECCLAVRPCV